MQFREEKRQPYGSFQHLFEAMICQRQGPGRMAHPHYQQTYEILYGLEGCCNVLLGTQTHVLHEGDMALFDPMELHCVDATSSFCKYVVLKFAKELLCPGERSMDEARLFLAYENCPDVHRKIFPKEMLSGEIPTLILRMLKSFQEMPLGFELSIRGDIARLFVWILRNTPLPEGGAPSLNAEDTRRMHQALEYIRGNFPCNVSLSEVAEHCGMGYSGFSRLFARTMRISFPDYILRRRLEYADFLLATTEKSVTEIAMETGFSSISYFILRFRQQRGITPARFRRRFSAPIHSGID